MLKALLLWAELKGQFPWAWQSIGGLSLLKESIVVLDGALGGLEVGGKMRVWLAWQGEEKARWQNVHCSHKDVAVLKRNL